MSSKMLLGALSFVIACNSTPASNPSGSGGKGGDAKASSTAVPSGDTPVTSATTDSGTAAPVPATTTSIATATAPSVATSTDVLTSTVISSATSTDSGSTDTSTSQASTIVPVYRLYKPGGDHLYTIDNTEGTTTGYQLEGEVYDVHTADADGLIPVYRCIANTGVGPVHFLSIESGCEGSTPDGATAMGFISKDEAAGTVPVFRCSNIYSTDFIETTDIGECNAAHYVMNGKIGYAVASAKQSP